MGLIKLYNHYKNSSERTKKAKRNVLTMFVIKGMSIAINLAMVPLLIKTLNTERYGIWLTISSIVALFSFLDIGIGHGLRNLLATAIANKDFDKAKKLVSTAYLSLSAIILLILISFILINPLINWATILNTPKELNTEIQILMLFVIGFFLVNFILRLLTSIMYAYQIPAFAELVVFLGQAFSYFSLLLLVGSGAIITLKDAGIILSVFPVIILLLFSIVLFSGKYKNIAPNYSCFKVDLVKNIFSLGIKFFFIQLTTIVIFQTNNLVIAHVLGSSSVTNYNIAYKYLGLLTLGFTIITTPFWSAATDAFAKKDFKWLDQSISNLKKIWLLFCVIGIILLLISNTVYRLWLGSSIISDLQILIPIFIYNVIQMRWQTYGMILNGIGKVKLQLYITSLEAIIHIPLSIFLAKQFGIAGVLFSMIIVTSANSIWPIIQFKRIKNNQAEGIWNK